MKAIAALLVIFSLISCSENDPLPGEENKRSFIDCPIIDSDPFDILSVSISDLKINVEVRYGGGCEEHNFCVEWPEAITAIYPPDFGIILNHEDNGDTCEALITETLVIDPSESDLGLSEEAIQNMRITVINGSDNTQVVSNR